MHNIGRKDCDGTNNNRIGRPERENASNYFTVNKLIDYFKRIFNFHIDNKANIHGNI